MSTTENVVEMKDEPKVKFRLFNKLEHSWYVVPEEWGDASFYIRPMKHSERSRLKNSEGIIGKIRDVKGAIDRSGVDGEKINSIPESTEEKIEQIALYSKVMDNIIVDKDAEEEHQREVQRVMVSCISKVSIEGEETDFTDEVYESIDSDSLRFWLMDKIKTASELSDGERSGL
jgi:hypothetical protein